MNKSCFAAFSLACLPLLVASPARATASSARFDRHDVLLRTHEYLRTSHYLRGRTQDLIVVWGWRALAFPVGRNALPREVVAENKEFRFSNGATAFDVGDDGNDELVVGRYRRDAATEQRIVWYERPADAKAPWIEHLIGAVPGADMPHDIQPIAVPLADGSVFRGVVVSIHRCVLYLFAPGDDPRQPWRRYDLGALPSPPQSGLTVGDINADGRPDIVTGMFWIETPADPRAGGWKFHRFAEWDLVNKPWGGMVKHSIADFDGDGEVELAVNEAEGPGARLVLFKRDATQPDGLWTSRTIDTGLYSPHSQAVADLDEDGLPDLIVGEMEAGGYNVPLKTNPRIYGYLNRGGGAFERVVLCEGTGVHEARIAPSRLHGRLAFYGNSTTQPWHDGMISHLSLWTVQPSPPGQLFRDDFSEGLAAGWAWLREDTNGWVARVDGLHVRALPGSLWGKANDAKNILLRPAPEGDFAASVRVDNAPATPSEQAGLLLHASDDAYLKLVKETVKDGTVQIVFAREEADRAKVVKSAPFRTGTEVVLRLTRVGGQVRAQFRRPDESAWQDLAECPAVPASSWRVGLAAHVTGVSDRWARFSDFELHAMPGAEGAAK